MKLIILDGPHSGEMVVTQNPIPPHSFAVDAPGHITIDEFMSSDKSIEDLQTAKGKVKVTYHLTFVSIDQGVCLYTMNGSAEAFAENTHVLNHWTGSTNSPYYSGDASASPDSQSHDDKSESGTT